MLTLLQRDHKPSLSQISISSKLYCGVKTPIFIDIGNNAIYKTDYRWQESAIQYGF